MKRRILPGVLAIVLAAGCGRTPQSTDTSASPASESNTTQTPGAPPLDPVPTATPEPRRLAPEGVFFLTEKIKVETRDGILGYPPGTKVLRMAGGFVTPDGQKIAVRSDQMTNDLVLAQKLAGNDAAAQAAVKNTLASLAPPVAAAAGAPLPPGSRSTTFSTVTTGPGGGRTVRETTTVHTTTTDPVTAKIKDLEKQKQVLFLQIEDQHAAMRTLTVKNPRKSPEAEQITQQIAALREKIRVIDEQMALARLSR